jgi:type II secretory pathway pseudopilin PulG
MGREVIFKIKIMTKIKNKKGLSLIEMLVSIFIFVLIITVSIAAFISVFSARKKTRDMQRGTEEARTALETMAKNIRMSNGLTFSGNTVKMYNNSQGQCIAYKFDDSTNPNTLQTRNYPAVMTDPTNPNCTNESGTYVDLMSSDFIGGEGFEVDTTNSSRIGKATIRIDIKRDSLSSIPVQTTVSFRDYQDVLY